MSEVRFTIEDIEFIGSLEWVTLDSVQKERPATIGKLVVGSAGSASKKEIERIGNVSSAVWRTLDKGVTQVGVSTGKPGAISIAAFVADMLNRDGVNNFLAVFPVGEGKFSLIAATDGLIQLSAETVGNQDEILSRAQEELSLVDSDVLIIAPKDFGLDAARHDTIESLLEQANKKTLSNAQLISIKPNYSRIGIVASVIMGIVGSGAFAWHLYQQNLIDEQARLAAKALMQQQLKGQQKQQSPQVPNVKVVPVSKALEACYATLDGADMHPGGWKLTGARCNTSEVVIQFDRNQSRIEWLKKIYPKAIMSLDGNFAEVRIAMPTFKNSIEMNEVPALSDVVDQINDRANSIGVALRLQKANTPPPALPGREQPQQISSEWDTVKWEATGAYGMTFNMFDLSTVSFESMTYTNGKIKIEGVIYGK